MCMRVCTRAGAGGTSQRRRKDPIPAAVSRGAGGTSAFVRGTKRHPRPTTPRGFVGATPGFEASGGASKAQASWQRRARCGAARAAAGGGAWSLHLKAGPGRRGPAACRRRGWPKGPCALASARLDGPGAWANKGLSSQDEGTGNWASRARRGAPGAAARRAGYGDAGDKARGRAGV